MDHGSRSLFPFRSTLEMVSPLFANNELQWLLLMLLACYQPWSSDVLTGGSPAESCIIARPSGRCQPDASVRQNRENGRARARGYARLGMVRTVPYRWDVSDLLAHPRVRDRTPEARRKCAGLRRRESRGWAQPETSSRDGSQAEMPKSPYGRRQSLKQRLETVLRLRRIRGLPKGDGMA